MPTLWTGPRVATPTVHHGSPPGVAYCRLPTFMDIFQTISMIVLQKRDHYLLFTDRMKSQRLKEVQ